MEERDPSQPRILPEKEVSNPAKDDGKFLLGYLEDVAGTEGWKRLMKSQKRVLEVFTHILIMEKNGFYVQDRSVFDALFFTKHFKEERFNRYGWEEDAKWYSGHLHIELVEEVLKFRDLWLTGDIFLVRVPRLATIEEDGVRPTSDLIAAKFEEFMDMVEKLFPEIPIIKIPSEVTGREERVDYIVEEVKKRGVKFD